MNATREPSSAIRKLRGAPRLKPLVLAFCRGNEIVYHRVVTDTPVEEMTLRQLKGLLLA